MRRRLSNRSFTGVAGTWALLVAGCSGSIGAPPVEGSASSEDHGPGGAVAPRAPGGTKPAPGTVGPAASSGACTSGPAVGLAPARRLTRLEYTNTVRDLLGAAADVPLSLVEDDNADLFAVGGRITTAGLEQYMQAASVLATRAAAAPAGLAPCASTGDDECAREVVTRFGRRAYRRPLLPAEVTNYLSLFARAKGQGDFASGLRTVVETMLQSPFFLYRLELGGEAGPNGLVALTTYELAARLSFFLWNRAPDEALLDVAAGSELKTEAGLKARTRKMLQDPRAKGTVDDFYSQFLGLSKLPSRDKDPKLFPFWTPEVRQGLHDSALRFVEHVSLEGDGRLATLLTGSFAFVNAKLAPIYGVSGAGDALAKTDLPVKERAGLLTLPAFLATNATDRRNLVVERGLFVREHMFCQHQPLPPADVPPAPEPDPNSTERERLAIHRADPACGGCHRLLDPIGFGFEGYDPVGRFRTMEDKFPVDASGEVLSTEDADGRFVGAAELARKLAGSAQVRACFSTKWMTYALGRQLEDADACTYKHVHQIFEASGGDLRELVVAIASSAAFRYRRPEAQP